MSKPNLLLLHGALGSKNQFTHLKRSLADQFNVYDLDFEGHGGRLSDKDYSISLFANNIMDFIEENSLVKTHIFGYSMGGYVALKLASENQTWIDRIVTLGTKFNWTPEIADKEVRMLNPSKVEEKVPKFATYLSKLHSPDDWKTIMRKTAQMIIDMGNGKKLSEIELSSITNKILIGIGELDNMVTTEESKYTAELIPNGELDIIEGLKHPIETVDVNRLAVLLRSFFIGDIQK